MKMSVWCKYCVGKTDFKCTIEGKEKDIIDGYVDWYCYDEIRAYANCPLVQNYGWNVTTATCIKLGKKNESVYKSLIDLKHDEFFKEKYNHFMKIYLGTESEKAIGSKLSGCIIPDEDKEKINEIYEKLEKIAELANSGETAKERSAARELAAQRYIMLVLRLVSLYGLQKEYRDYRNNNTGYNQKKFAKTYKRNVEKNKKTLDK